MSISKKEDFRNFLSMQLLFRSKESNVNFLKTIAGIEELQSHISDEMINTEADYVDLIEDICDDLSSSTVFGKYKN